MRRIDALETLIRELHLSTREHVAKGLCGVAPIEKWHIIRVVKELQDINGRLKTLENKHQADHALVSGTVGLVSQSILHYKAQLLGR